MEVIFSFKAKNTSLNSCKNTSLNSFLMLANKHTILLEYLKNGFTENFMFKKMKNNC